MAASSRQVAELHGDALCRIPVTRIRRRGALIGRLIGKPPVWAAEVRRNEYDIIASSAVLSPGYPPATCNRFAFLVALSSGAPCPTGPSSPTSPCFTLPLCNPGGRNQGFRDVQNPTPSSVTNAPRLGGTCLACGEKLRLSGWGEEPRSTQSSIAKTPCIRGTCLARPGHRAHSPNHPFPGAANIHSS
ncbi:hypothetical protein SKAU_G00146720 [Synaphobranchus kaupii]|uniref:Uncharacterized protein n=1 Tax=Synaphobranchus kaupii TaxID=118154 RepID=A0A9Q1J4I3_SYNKA|nr:hypothetical protein SKAU_G00146720 [Synaphobranchus kaupii]